MISEAVRYRAEWAAEIVAKRAGEIHATDGIKAAVAYILANNPREIPLARSMAGLPREVHQACRAELRALDVTARMLRRQKSADPIANNGRTADAGSEHNRTP